MAAEPEKLDREELEAWLRKQPPEVSVAIAARCALRVQPLVQLSMDLSNAPAANLLPVYRANSLAFSYRKGSESTKDRLTAAVAAAAGAAANAKGTGNLSATLAAALAATIAATDAGNAARNAALAVANAANAATNAELGAANATALASDQHNIENGLQAQGLAIQPLWPDGHMPDELAKYWEELKSVLLSRGEAWDVWTNWYDDRLAGNPPEDEALAVARVTLPEPMWREGPKLVNATIKELTEFYNKGGPEMLEARMAELREQYQEDTDGKETAAPNSGSSEVTPEDVGLSRQNLDPEEIGPRFGRLVRQKRFDAGLSLSHLAMRAFGNEDRKAWIATLESGRIRRPAARRVQAIAQALELTAEDLAPFRELPKTGPPETSSGEPSEAEQSERTADTLPNAWILQYNTKDWADAPQRIAQGTLETWKTKGALPRKLQPDDPVIYWRTTEDGGFVGTGHVLSRDLGPKDEEGWRRFPTEVHEFDQSRLIPRDEVIEAAGITRKNWRGAVLPLSEEEALKLDDLLRRERWQPIFSEELREKAGFPIRGQPRITETHDTDFVSDRPETAKDLLNRASLAFALAAHVNRIWTSQTSGQGDKNRVRKVLDWLHFERFNRRTKEPDDAAFILHIDAPWGGGKTTFANFLARILNPVGHGDDPDNKKKTEKTLLDGLPLKDPRYWDPEFSKRRWFVVDFNAWQNEHVSPPWWNFYGTIRRQCLREILFEPGRYGGVMLWRGLQRAFSWCRFQITEIIWRVATPEMARTLLALAVVAGLIYWASGTEWYQNLSKPPPSSGDGNADPNQYVPLIKALLGVAATGGAGLAVINAFKSGVKTIVESAGKSANASSLGVADPIQKFRRHFSWFTEQLDDPVMVIVDDLDRCSPKYVVELVRGLLTIFRSPRVVFVLLGDKDWIETAFAKVYKEMAEVHKDTQTTFGGRFAEKAIQLSFVLPEADEDTREAYLTEILKTGKDAAAPEEQEQVRELEDIQKEIRSELASADKIAEQSEAIQRSETRIEERISKAAPEKQEGLRKATRTILNRESMLRAATAKSAEAEIRQHGLDPLKNYLPGNPRRIKRIVNMVGAYQASAQSTSGVALGSDKWKQLVLWIVIMSEYPQVWHRLVKDDVLSATLFDAIQNSGTEKTIEIPTLDDEASDEQKAIAALLKTPGLVPLLRGDPFAAKKGAPSPARIDTAARNWLSRLTPIE